MPWYFNVMMLLPWLTPFIVGYVFYRVFYLPRKRQKRLNAIGLLGTATIYSISDTGVTINDNPQVRYHCTVTPALGAPYKASTTMLMSRLDRPLPLGTVVRVKIDPSNPQSFIFV